MPAPLKSMITLGTQVWHISRFWREFFVVAMPDFDVCLEEVCFSLPDPDDPDSHADGSHSEWDGTERGEDAALLGQGHWLWHRIHHFQLGCRAGFAPTAQRRGTCRLSFAGKLAV